MKDKTLKESAHQVLKPEELTEAYVEIMDPELLKSGLDRIAAAWKEWVDGPATKDKHIKPAQKELKSHIDKWFKKNIK